MENDFFIINNFVYAAFHTGHAVQMFGFVPDAHIGDEFMSWGMYDRITKFAGKYTLPQGFFIEQNAAQFEIRHSTGLRMACRSGSVCHGARDRLEPSDRDRGTG